MSVGLDGLAIRPARKADLDALGALQEASILALGRAAYDEPRLLAWARVGTAYRHRLLEEATVLVAECEGRIVGVGGWSPDGLEPAQAWIRYLFVHPEMARRGIGRRLVTAAESLARSAGRVELVVWSSVNAVAFYAALGYRRERDVKLPLGPDLELDCVLMVKPAARRDGQHEAKSAQPCSAARSKA
ncbi:MAG: GNAT family N-acetyltransferase [Geminicoccales bacterium]